MPNGMRTIVSLTSFPARIGAAAKVIETMARQTVRPDKIVLYLTAAQFPDGKVPDILSRLQSKLVDIRFCGPPIKSYTKLVPALKDFPDDIVITVDDDMDYPNNLISTLLRAHRKYPRAICAHRVRRVKFKNGRPLPYLKWPRLNRRIRKHVCGRRPRLDNLAMGVGGVLYPPRCLDAAATRDDIFMKMAPTADDLWFWAMAAKAGTGTAFVRNDRVKDACLTGTQETSLLSINCAGDGNDRAMANILAEFPEIRLVASR